MGRNEEWRPVEGWPYSRSRDNSAATRFGDDILDAGGRVMHTGSEQIRRNRGRTLARVMRQLAEAYDQAQEENWDGYGARPADPASRRVANEFLLTLPFYIPYPNEVHIDPDGSISLDWDYSARRTLSVSVEGDGVLHYAGLFGGNRVWGTEEFNGSYPKDLDGHFQLLLSNAS